MHIGQIVFFVPSRGRQDNIGLERACRHTEIEVKEQIQLALQCAARFGKFVFVAPLNFRRLNDGFFFSENAVARAEQVL